jgi:hypothetical protein
MRRALALAVLALFAAPAALAAGPTNAQLAAQIKALQARVTKDEKTIKTLQQNVDEAGVVGAAALTFGICGLAIASDVDQGIFAVLDQIAVNTPNVARTFFGPQVPITEPGACNALKVVRTQAVPPTTAAFSALFSLLRSSSAFHALAWRLAS